MAFGFGPVGFPSSRAGNSHQSPSREGVEVPKGSGVSLDPPLLPEGGRHTPDWARRAGLVPAELPGSP